MPGAISTSFGLRLGVLVAVVGLAAAMFAGPVSGATGPYLVKDINSSGDSFPNELTPMDGKLFFVAGGGGRGRELWMSDGTVLGTKRVKDIWPGPTGSDPRFLTAIGGVLYFGADGNNGKGVELFRSDGTKAGTWLLADINPGPSDSYPFGFTEFNGLVYFSADDGVTGRELWRTDGTELGTWRVKDIAPGAESSEAGGFFELAGKLVFTAFACPTLPCDITLYKTNGSAAGTKPFKDRRGREVTGHINRLSIVGSRLYFVRDDIQLWRTNGGSSTLRRLGDFGPHGEIVGAGGNAFFNTAGELWKSNGTAAGTVKITEIMNGEFPAHLVLGTDVNGTLFFTADDTLYKSDGTELGTVEVDPAEQVELSGDAEMTVIGTTLYFTGPAADSGSCHRHDATLWQSDGTPEGTFEVSPTPSNCRFGGLTPAGSSLYFVADDGVHGLELWRYVP